MSALLATMMMGIFAVFTRDFNFSNNWRPSSPGIV